MTPASLELAEIAMMALSTSATVPWIYTMSVKSLVEARVALRVQHWDSFVQAKLELSLRHGATSL